MRTVETATAPIPAGHYSQAMVHGGLVYVAGQLPFDPENPDAPLGDMASQASQALNNVRAILQAAGSGMDRLLQVTIYISDLSHWGTVNEVYRDFLGEHRPARCVVPVPELHHGYMIEIQAIAAVPAEEEGS